MPTALVLAPRSASDDEEEAVAPPAKVRSPGRRAATVTDHLQTVEAAEEREGDPEFNALLQAARGLGETAVGIRMLIGGAAPTQIANSLQNLQLHVLHSLTHSDGRRYVPGGELQATRLGQSTQSSLPSGFFPHVLQATATGEQFVVECEKKIILRAVLVENGDTGRPISQVDLARRLEAVGVPAGDVLFELALCFYARDHDGAYGVPSGYGEGKTFKAAFANADRTRSQLLQPDEGGASYTIGLHCGMLSYSLSVRAGVTSAASIPKGAQFVFEIRCKHPRLQFLRAASEPFLLASRFRVNETSLARGEMYVDDGGGEPQAVPTGKRKRGYARLAYHPR
jgi:hypothetical protein